jgi:hypothetical protein
MQLIEQCKQDMEQPKKPSNTAMGFESYQLNVKNPLPTNTPNSLPLQSPISTTSSSQARLSHFKVHNITQSRPHPYAQESYQTAAKPGPDHNIKAAVKEIDAMDVDPAYYGPMPLPSPRSNFSLQNY